MRIHVKTALFALLAAATMTSCSVKEMRDVCPCWVDLDFSRCFASDTCGDLRSRICEVNIYRADGSLYGTRIFSTDTMADHYEVTVDRAGYTCSALFYEDYLAYTHNDASIVATASSQSDSLYGSFKGIDATGERATADFDALKQFANLNVRFVNAPDSLWLTLSGITSSVETMTLSALEDSGSSVKTLYTTAKDGYSVNYSLLRQWDGDITFTVASVFSGNTLAALDLRSILENEGYDFRDPWLRDIYLVIDFRRGTGLITVEGWEREIVVALF